MREQKPAEPAQPEAVEPKVEEPEAVEGPEVDPVEPEAVEPRTETYEAVRPDGTRVHVVRNLDTGEQSVSDIEDE